MQFRYSSISDAYQCLKKFEIKHILGIHKEGSSAAMEFGTAIHLGIKAMFEDGDPEQTFTIYWSSIKDEIQDYPRYPWAELLAMGKTFLGRFEKLHFKKFKPYKIETTMTAKIGDNILQGTADFIGEYNGTPSVFDWKTSASVYSPWKLKTNEQLYGYAYLVMKNFNYKPEVLGYKVFVKSDMRIQTVTLQLTQPKLDDMMANVDVMMRDLAKRTEWPRNPGCFCITPEICFPKG